MGTSWDQEKTPPMPIEARHADVPLLMIAFNRPEKTLRVLEAVRAVAPRQLYVAVDGPRAGHAGDEDRCARTRRLFDRVDWPCDLHTLFRERNLGCKQGVGTAIDWFLSKVEAGIILEDDCLPTADFFPYCGELLDRFRDTTEVMMIGGHNPLGEWNGGVSGPSYVFSRTCPIWGWATWRRAWAHYDPAMTRWSDARAREAVRARMPRAEFRITRQRFDSVYEGTRDTWDFGWAFAMLVAGGVSVIPASNLVANIGFDGEATHTKIPWSHEASVPTRPLAFPLRHPASTVPDDDFERALFRRRFPLTRRLGTALPQPLQEGMRAALRRLTAAAPGATSPAGRR
jgi:hypothetical protein